MKKLITSVFAIICVILCGITLACKFEIPQKVSVKTSADFSFNVGNVSKNLEDVISIDKIFSEEKMSESFPNAQVFDYFPEEKNPQIKQFLMKFPLLEMPIDMGEYYEKSDVSKELKSLSFNKEITVPDVNITKEQDIELSFVNDGLNKSFTFGGLASTVKGKPTFQAEFKSIEYYNLILEIKGFDGGGHFSNGTTVKIYKNGNFEKSGTFTSDVATIDLEEFSFGKDDLEIEFSEDEGQQYLGSIKDSSKIKKATGITYPSSNPAVSSTDLSDEVHTTMTMPDSFVAAQIEKGTLVTQVSIPWSGSSVSYGVTTTGALEVTEAKSTLLDKNISLDDKIIDRNINSGKIDVTAPITIRFTNATIDFTQKPKIKIYTDIKSFKEVTIVTDNVNTQVSKTEAFSSDVYETVHNLKLIPSGVKGTYTNTLPNGNDITLVGNSEFFNIVDKSSNLSSGKTDAEFTPIFSDGNREVEIVKLEEQDIPNNKFGAWDFTMDIKFPGATPEHPDYITIKNVKPKEVYKIGVDINPELNWEYADINPPDTFNRKEQKPLGIKFSELFDSLSDAIGIENLNEKIDIVSVPIYIRAEKPKFGDAFDNLQFNTNLSMYYAKLNGEDIEKVLYNGNPIQKDIIGTEGNPSSLVFVEPISEYEMKNKCLITNISKINSSAKNDISDLLNESRNITEGELYVDYNIDLAKDAGDGVRVFKADCDNSSSTSISVTVFIDIPIKFRVRSETEPLIFDLNTLTGNTEGNDLFGRSGPEPVGGEGISDYTQVIESCGLKYVTKGMPFFSDPAMQIRTQMSKKGEEKLLNTDGDTMLVRTEDLNRIFSADSYPYRPEFEIRFPPKAEFSLQRELLLNVNVTLMVNTDGSINIYGGK